MQRELDFFLSEFSGRGTSTACCISTELCLLNLGRLAVLGLDSLRTSVAASILLSLALSRMMQGVGVSVLGLACSEPRLGESSWFSTVTLTDLSLFLLSERDVFD